MIAIQDVILESCVICRRDIILTIIVMTSAMVGGDWMVDALLWNLNSFLIKLGDRDARKLIYTLRKSAMLTLGTILKTTKIINNFT